MADVSEDKQQQQQQNYAPIQAMSLDIIQVTDEKNHQENDNVKEEEEEENVKVMKTPTPRGKSPKPKTTTKINGSFTDMTNGNHQVERSYIEDYNITSTKQYHTVPGLKLRRHHLLQEASMIDGQLKDMQELKQIVKKFSTKMKEFSAAILNLDRNRQGVPYVANVKSLFQNINQELVNETTKQQIGKLNAHDIPFIMDLNVQFRNLNKLCEQIIVHHIHYHVTYLEDFHSVAGKIRGMMKAIVGLYYTDDEKTDDFLDQSFDDLILNSDEKECFSDEDEDDDDNDDDVRTNNSSLPLMSPRMMVNTGFYHEFEYPQIVSARATESMKHLDNLRKKLREANQILGNINRLSLGNPKIQSLRDYFKMVGELLSKINLTSLKVNDVRFADKIEAGIVKMIRMSTLKRPSERHIEQMKLLLGEVDGRVYVLIKNLAA